ncbi:cysteine synthase A [Lutibacter sp. B2]|nr:cysteine synthase A [Lutibacter sp. B2]
MKVANNIVELIGNTPMVRLNEFLTEEDANVYLKLEFFNPGSSIKDRVALSMIEEAEKQGILKKGSVIVEPTSGNTGIGLAMIGAAKGYKVILVMPETMSIERRKLVKAFGAEIVLTEGALGMKGAINKATQMIKENPVYFMPQQFENLANPQAHRNTTAIEILDQMNGKIDMVISAVGTGGTITGIGETLKNKIEDVKVVAVEPKKSAVLSGKPAGAHGIQGIGAGFIPEILNTKVIDEIVQVEDEDAMQIAREVAIKEGVLVGISSGAAIYAAIKKAKELGKGKEIVVIVPDCGERYLSTSLFDFK